MTHEDNPTRRPIRVAAVADLHGRLPHVPPCDLLLIAGDMAYCRKGDHRTEARFLAGSFRRWLDEVPATQIVGIAGNHDLLFEQAPAWIPPGLRWTYLQDGGTEVCGFKVWGSPQTPEFCDWAFNLPEDRLAERWALIPADTDILVTHGPPYGVGDYVLGLDGGNVGSPSLLAAVERVRPKLHVFGHIHEGHGTVARKTWPDGKVTTMANVSVVDQNYTPVRGASVFDLEE